MIFISGQMSFFIRAIFCSVITYCKCKVGAIRAKVCENRAKVAHKPQAQACVTEVRVIA